MEEYVFMYIYLLNSFVDEMVQALEIGRKVTKTHEMPAAMSTFYREVSFKIIIMIITY